MAETTIRSVRHHIKKLISVLGFDRSKWFSVLPYLNRNIDSTEIHSAGLSRLQLLFSPLVQYTGLQLDQVFKHQSNMYQKIFDNRNKILQNRRKKFGTLNNKFRVGMLVFRLDEEQPANVSHTKQLPSCLDLYLVVFIPKAPTDGGVIKASDSNFKVWIRNLRSGQTSVTYSSNLRPIKLQEMAHFSSDLYNKFQASLSRFGNIKPGASPRLSLLGLEETQQKENEKQSNR